MKNEPRWIADMDGRGHFGCVLIPMEETMGERMVMEKSWAEFRSIGLLWWINQILHVFGWAIVVTVDEVGDIVDAYPARVRFRGFHERAQEEGYRNISRYMADNAHDLLEEAEQ